MTDQPTPGNRRFYRLHRPVDVSGISGTGFPAEIAVFSDGHAAIHWPGRYPTTTPHPGGLAWTEGIHCHHGTTLEPLDDPRLARIAEAHSKDAGEGGLTNGDCNECGHPHPCPTYIWATTDRDPLATWDPNDDDDEPDNPPTTTKETTT